MRVPEKSKHARISTKLSDTLFYGTSRLQARSDNFSLNRDLLSQYHNYQNSKAKLFSKSTKMTKFLLTRKNNSISKSLSLIRHRLEHKTSCSGR